MTLASAASTDQRLGVEGDAESRLSQHVQVVRAVPDGYRLRNRNARCGREPLQRLGLALSIDDLADEPTRQPTVADLEGVGRAVVDPELGHEPSDDLGEPAAHERDLIAEPLQRPDQRARAGGEHDLAAYDFQCGLGQPLEESDAASQRRTEVQLAVHGGLRDRRDLGQAAGLLGQHLDDLTLDEGRVDVHDDQPLGAAVQAGRLDGDVDRLRGCFLCQRGAQLARVRSGDLELDAGDRIAREPHDAVDVRAELGDPAGQRGDDVRSQRVTEDGDVDPAGTPWIRLRRTC